MTERSILNANAYNDETKTDDSIFIENVSRIICRGRVFGCVFFFYLRGTIIYVYNVIYRKKRRRSRVRTKKKTTKKKRKEPRVIGSAGKTTGRVCLASTCARLRAETILGTSEHTGGTATTRRVRDR